MPRRTAEEAAIDQQLRRERETSDLLAFLNCYERATSFELELIDAPENPDFICRRSDGLEIGIELTQIRRSPDDAFWEATLDGRDEMDAEVAFDEFSRLLMQKARKLSLYSTKYNLLLLQNCETDFQILRRWVERIPLDDFVESGFNEVWLGDYTGIRQGAHREICLLGLYPVELRIFVDRSFYDSKPYG